MKTGIKDEMENGWGVDFLPVVPRGTRKTLSDLSAIVVSTVKGFSLMSLLASGTEVNMHALLTACSYDLSTALIALGSYVGGDQFTQEMSSSMYDAKSSISLPKYVANASARCLAQTVPMPYHIHGSSQISNEHVKNIEDQCLRSLHKRLVVAKLEGKPYRGLLLELMLSGNGCSLSRGFLEKLGRLCTEMDVAIVVDEVLTGGRAGPGMIMTTSMPQEFIEAVKFITMGKFLGCAVVLKKISKKPSCNEERLRGTSTSQDAGGPYLIWEEVHKRIQAGEIEQRREEVLTAMDVPDSEGQWGFGLVIFTNRHRWQTHRSLKNRLLPKLAPGMKIQKSGSRKSEWTRSSVTEEVLDVVSDWLVAVEAGYCHHIGRAFLSQVVQYIFFVAKLKLEPQHSNEAGYIRFCADEVVRYMGIKEAEKIAKIIRAIKIDMGFLCKMTPVSFVQEAILQAHYNNHRSRIFYKKRKTSTRTEFTFVRADLFGSLGGSTGEFVLFS